VLSRRTFTFGAMGALLFPKALFAGELLLATAARDKQGNYGFYLLDSAGNTQLTVPLAKRAHAVAVHPSQPLLAVFSRRPGTEITLIDYQRKAVVNRLYSQAGFHLYGHGFFTENGRYLVTSENRFADGHGRLVIRDLEQQGEIVADYSSYGIGPHELAQMPNQDVVVVANGGILTHPDQGRAKLNLDTMQPSLAYVSLTDGQLLQQSFLPQELQQLSIRHLAINPQGSVVLAMQYQGDPSDEVPLVALHKQGAEIELLTAPMTTTFAMKQYCGSVSCDLSGRYALVSSPRGNLMTLWDLLDAEFVDQFRCKDGCGVVSHQAEGFILSNGRGNFYEYLVGSRKLKKIATVPTQAWDNHLNLIA